MRWCRTLRCVGHRGPDEDREVDVTRPRYAVLERAIIAGRDHPIHPGRRAALTMSVMADLDPKAERYLAVVRDALAWLQDDGYREVDLLPVRTSFHLAYSSAEGRVRRSEEHTS